MRSLRTRITLLTVLTVVVTLAVVTISSEIFIRKNERRETEQLLLLMCETGEHNLNYYFDGVKNSVGKVVSFVEDDLNGLDTAQLEGHMLRVRKFFDEMVYRTNGVLTYYYRIDPEISDTVKGFWYTNLDGKGFTEHEVTDITLYDTQDTSRLVWFTVPKHDGKPIWLPPYITDNLDVRVISYNVPIYYRGRFVGVVGIEIDYSTMAEQVESIRLYSSGYAYLSDASGALFFHPHIDVSALTDDRMPAVPEGAVGSATFFRYTFEGVEKQGAWLPLSNGMRLNVTVPISETDAGWQRVVRMILVFSGGVLLAMSAFTMLYTRRITRPLEELTQAAEQVNRGDYDFTLLYSGNDEVGRLTSTFRRLADHMREHITDLNKRVYVDALTSVKNKGAFSSAIEELQNQMDGGDRQMQHAIGVFDCDDLKTVNDRYGHENGDVYLKTACQTICRVFSHSPVFRIGGDEFSVILKNRDYENREQLIRQLEKESEEINADNENQWNQVHIAKGVAVYDPKSDRCVIDTLRRADKIMYADKQARKQVRRR